MSKLLWATAVVGIGLASASTAVASMPSGLGGAGGKINEPRSGALVVDWRDEHHHHHYQFYFGQSDDFQRPDYNQQYYGQQYYDQRNYDQQFDRPNDFFWHHRHHMERDMEPGFRFRFGY